MAQAREKGGRVVFIGNIPYGVSEEQISEIFGRVGQVVSFRLVYDKETHRPKGFGFLEYTNVDDAASAVRNLNDFDVMGRKIKVDYSNDNGGSTGARLDGVTTGVRPGGPNGVDAAAVLPRLPDGTDVPAGLTAPDAISRTLQNIPPAQLLDIISQMKNLVSTNAAQATALLSTAPQLSYAIFQALLLLGLVDPSVLGTLIQQTAQAPPQQPQPSQPPAAAPFPGFNQPAAASYSAAPAQTYVPPPQSFPVGVPQPQQSAYQPAPVQAAPQVQDPGQQALINQVLSMTRDQIMALDDVPRNQILALRAQLGAPPI